MGAPTSATMTHGPLCSSWHLTVPWWEYLVCCVVAALVVRGVLCLDKAAAIGTGGHLSEDEMKTPDVQRDLEQRGVWVFCKRYWTAFSGFLGHPNIADYWLPAIIGFSEASAYPVLMVLDRCTVIGAWLLIKTAGNWRGWVRSRATYNRYLVGNILVIAISYLWLTHFVEVAVAAAGH